MSAGAAHNLDARTAELIARQLNSAYMNACGFGVDHPTTRRACQSFHATLAAALEDEPSLSLILDRGTLFVEKHPAGQRFNPRRLLDAFNELDLQSITFSAGISKTDIRALIRVLARLLDYPSLAAAEAALKKHQSGAIRFNYIVYRKLTSDQKVVSDAAEGNDPGELLRRTRPKAPQATAADRVLNQLDSLFSLGALAGNPDVAAERLTAPSQRSKQDRARLVDHLKRLAREVETGSGSVEGLSPEQLFGAINTLRQRVARSLAAQEDADRVMAGSDEVVSEVDELTYSTLVRLVREEYRSGHFSIPRIAQLVNRMLPDAGDRQRLLPRLRRGLLREGMAPEHFAELVGQLAGELRGQQLARALQSGADSVGLEVDEIVRQIQQDPAEAARLVVLAAELRHGGVGDEQQLSSAFTDYFERVSQQLALGATAGNAPLDADTLGEELARVQQELLARMRAGGLAPEASKQLEQELEQRLPGLRQNSKVELFGRALDGGELTDDTLVLDWLERQVASPAELKQLADPLCRQLERHGHGPQQAARLIEALGVRLTTERAPPQLPSSVLSVESTALFLRHQVKGAQRYGNPFSVIKILVEWLVSAQTGASGRPRRSDLHVLLPELYARIVRLVRDLDLVGSLEKSRRAIPLLILPMTDEPGAWIFRERLLKALAQFPVRFDRGEFYLSCTITAVGFDPETDRDASAFIQRVNRAHEANRAENSRQAASET